MSETNAQYKYAKVARHSNGPKSLMIIPSPVDKNVSNSKIKLSPISKASQGSSKIMGQDIKEIKSALSQKEHSLPPLNLKISKEVTITPITRVSNTENNIISMLKKLPDITFNLVKSEPVFKVPESPKLKTNNTKNNITPHNQSNIFIKKKILSEIRDVKAINKTRNVKNIINMNLNPSKTLKQKQIFNNIIPLVTKSSDKEILKNPETSKKYPVSEKENEQRTSSPKKLPKKKQSSSKIKPKSLKFIKPVEEVTNKCNILSKEVNPVEELSNDCNIFSNEQKTISDKDSNSIVNNLELKTNKVANEDYMLMDLSTGGQINIVPASCPLDFMNIIDPEYDNFLMGISKFPKESTTDLETSQNDTEIGSLLTKHELNQFEDFLGCVNTSLNINKSNDIHSELVSAFSNKGHLSLDDIQNEQLHINKNSSENFIEKFEKEQNSKSDENENGMKRKLSENKYYKNKR